MPLSISSRPRPVPSSRRGGAFFHHLIVSSRIPSASFHLVSFPVSDDSGAMGVSSRSPSPASFRIASSHQMRASKTTGRGWSVLSSYPVAFFYLAAIPSPSRSSSRSIVSSCVSPRLVPSRVISSDDGQASKEAGRVIILGPVSSASAPSSVRPGVPSPGSRAVITSSPHPQQASKQAGGENETTSWRRRGSRSLVPPGQS